MPVTVLAAHVLGLSRLRTELGSPAADQVLGELARAFAGVLRIGDIAYRIGEDEFALLLPATDGAAVPAIRERLEAVTAEVVAELDLPGSPRQIALRTAAVPLEAVRAGRRPGGRGRPGPRAGPAEGPLDEGRRAPQLSGTARSAAGVLDVDGLPGRPRR